MTILAQMVFEYHKKIAILNITDKQNELNM
jgi:hypothetical protein